MQNYNFTYINDTLFCKKNKFKLRKRLRNLFNVKSFALIIAMFFCIIFAEDKLHINNEVSLHCA